MHPQPDFSVKDLFSHAIGDMAKAISERSGEGAREQFVRARAAAAMIVELQPRDVIEVMLAGHCVMFHALMTDSIHDTLRGEMDTQRRGTRSNIVAMNKAFQGNLDRLERYQLRPDEGMADSPRDKALRTDSANPATQPAQPSAPDVVPPSLPDPPAKPTIMAHPPQTPPKDTTSVAIKPGPTQVAPEVRQQGRPAPISRAATDPSYHGPSPGMAAASGRVPDQPASVSSPT